MNTSALRCLLAAILASLAVYFEQIGAAIAILGGVMILDYITGMVKAYITSSLCSKKGMRGIVKKLSYFIVVLTGSVCDWVLAYALGRLGIHYAIPFFIALLITVWLIINEMISILENLSAIGVPLPAFLSKLLKRLAVAVEKSGDQAAQSTEEQPSKENNHESN